MSYKSMIMAACICTSAFSMSLGAAKAAAVFDFKYTDQSGGFGYGALTGTLDPSGKYYNITGASGALEFYGYGASIDGATDYSNGNYKDADDRLYYPAKNDVYFDSSGINIETSDLGEIRFFALDGHVDLNGDALNNYRTTFQITGTSGVGGVPEPSTWAMILLGFSGIGFLAYRKARDGSAVPLVAA